MLHFQRAKTQKGQERKVESAMTENEIAKIVVDCAYKVHTTLGPGLLEHIYEVALQHELKKRGLEVVRQIPVPIVFDGIRFDEGFRMDLLVENKVVVEIKSIEEVHPKHRMTVLSYLRLADKRLALLINFNVQYIKDGITRIVNGLPDA
jgi:GxxExxY protein